MQSKLAVWDFVPLSEFDPPTPPAVDAARSRIRRLWRTVASYLGSDEDTTPAKEDLGDRPSPQELEVLAPPLEWHQAATRLAGYLSQQGFMDPMSARPHVALVGSPGCEMSHILLPLAAQQAWRVLEAPTPQTILADPTPNPAVLAPLDAAKGHVVVIPRLERWFLRHVDGLVLLRQLLERLIHQRHQVVIGCDSWAWAYLQQAIKLEDMLGVPLTLAAFDGPRLDAWFRSTALLQNYAFRQSNDDALLFSELDRPQSDAEQPQVNALIRNLAARSRGNPVVALALWRACLRNRPDKAEAAGGTNGPHREPQSRFWVASLSSSEMPHLPNNVDRVHRFVLHACLLHGGLPLPVLFQLLPFSFQDIQSRVGLLLRAGILIEVDERLQVATAAYPAIRMDLESEGFLTDGL